VSAVGEPPATEPPATEPPVLDRLVSVPNRGPGSEPRAPDLVGVDLQGVARRVRVSGSGRSWLLLFLGARCDGCGPFWLWASDPGAPVAGVADELVIVTRPPPHEDPAALQELLATATGSGVGAAARRAVVLLSATAWRDYRVQGPPFFALVEQGRVVVEGVAWSVGYVAAEVGGSRRRPEPPGGRPGAKGTDI
jgi:hypothetical protein